MKKYGRKQGHIWRCLLLGMVMLCMILPMTAAWAVPSCDVTIHYVYEEVALPGVEFRMYRVAELNDRYEPVYTGVFADWKWDPENPETGILDLYTLVEQNDLLPEYCLTTDEKGEASLSDLTAGVFLMVGEPLTLGEDTYYVDMQLVSIPIQLQGQWVHSVTLQPKCTKVTHQEPIEITAVKRWEDLGYENERPKSISVSLLLDGKSVSTVVLSAENNWTYTWQNLLPNAKWSVQEDVPEGYSLTLERQDNTFILTNHRKTIPQTGQIWWPVLTAVALGLLLMCLGVALVRGKRRDA